MLATDELSLNVAIARVRTDGWTRWRDLGLVLVIVALLRGASGCSEEVSSDLRRCRPASQDRLLSTDEEIRSFAGCEVLEGSLQVGRNVSELSPLSSLKVIDGSISGGGYRSDPFSLDGLGNVEVIGGDLHFLADNVTSFRGLTKLQSVGGWLRVMEVPGIEDFRGLEKVRSLSRLDIQYNPELRTLAGLEGLEEVKGDVYISGNDKVPEHEVDALLARIKVEGEIHRF